jgi:hypothetical protein
MNSKLRRLWNALNEGLPSMYCFFIIFSHDTNINVFCPNDKNSHKRKNNNKNVDLMPHSANAKVDISLGGLASTILKSPSHFFVSLADELYI